MPSLTFSLSFPPFNSSLSLSLALHRDAHTEVSLPLLGSVQAVWENLSMNI